MNYEIKIKQKQHINIMHCLVFKKTIHGHILFYVVPMSNTVY